MSTKKQCLVTLTAPLPMLNEVLLLCVNTAYFSPEHAADSLPAAGQYQKFSAENEASALRERLGAVYKILQFSRTAELPASRTASFTLQECEKNISGYEAFLTPLAKRRDECIAISERCTMTISQFDHYTGIDLPLDNIFAARFVAVRFGRLPLDSYRLLPAYQNNPDILFIPVSTDRQYCWGMYVVPRSRAEKADRVFAAMLFERLHVPETAQTPGEAVAQLETERQAAETEKASIEKRLAAYASENRNSLEITEDSLRLLCRIEAMQKYAVRSADHFILTGHIPYDNAENFYARFPARLQTELFVIGAKTHSKGAVKEAGF